MDKKGLPNYFLKNEIDKILTAAQIIPQSYFFCKFLWRTGTRVAEALEITPEDIDFKEKTVTVRTKKRRTPHKREIPISEEFLEEINSFIQKRSILKTNRVFSFTSRTAFNYVSKACWNAELRDERAHPSSFRHSYAIHCLINGISIDKVNELLGNRDIKKSMIYLKLLNQDKNQFGEIIW